jgi:hypothetical protein
VECILSAEGLGGPNSKLKLLEDALKSRAPVLGKYVDMKPENELQALLAIQRLMVRYVTIRGFTSRARSVMFVMWMSGTGVLFLKLWIQYLHFSCQVQFFASILFQ